MAFNNNQNYYQPVYNGNYVPAVPDQLGQLRAQQGFPRMPSPMGGPMMGGQPQEPQQPIIWVQGIEGARAYLVAPGCTVQLWDAERQTIYLKSADPAGVPSMRVLDYTERIMGGTPTAQTNGVEYATKQEVEELKGLLNSLIIPSKGKKMKEDADNG